MHFVMKIYYTVIIKKKTCFLYKCCRPHLMPKCGWY